MYLGAVRAHLKDAWPFSDVMKFERLPIRRQDGNCFRKRLGGGAWRYWADTGPLSHTQRPPTQYTACRGLCTPFPPCTCLLQLHPVHLQQQCLTLTQIWHVVGPFPRPVSASCIRAQTKFAWIPSRAGGLAQDSITVMLLSSFDKFDTAGGLY